LPLSRLGALNNRSWDYTTPDSGCAVRKCPYPTGTLHPAEAPQTASYEFVSANSAALAVLRVRLGGSHLEFGWFRSEYRPSEAIRIHAQVSQNH